MLLNLRVKEHKSKNKDMVDRKNQNDLHHDTDIFIKTVDHFRK